MSYEFLVSFCGDVRFVIESLWVQLPTIPLSCNDFWQIVPRHLCPKTV